MKKAKNFIEHIIDEDLRNGFDKSKLRFRFPPEPNGYLHVGHVKAIVLNFELAKKYSAKINLRFDDTNPEKEEQKYIDAIKSDIKWLNYKWDNELYASDYFQTLHDWAVNLIENDKAYVDSQNSEKIASQKGTPTEPGLNSPFRDRPIEESLAMFKKMTIGHYKQGENVLRAKIDMSSPNMLMRDPVIYRVINKPHPRTKDKWIVYPMYDWTHGESDYIEQISHSLCTLEFKPHRELYDWFLDQVVDSNKIRPKQREFARLNLSHTITSKRKLLFLVENNIVDGWDDPRMPTISGLRRRGYSPNSLKKFVETAGVAKRENIIEMSLLEFCVREDLNKKCNRLMVVQDPIKIFLTNYEKLEEKLILENNPESSTAGSRDVMFSKNLYIEREDFMENPTKKFFRLSLDNEVRLKGAYIIKANKVIKDPQGNITEVHCTYDPKSKSGSGSPESQRKVKATLHWVSQPHSVPIEIREYERLFNHPSPADFDTSEFDKILNKDSIKKFNGFGEKVLEKSNAGESFQFQRKGYYVADTNSNKNGLVFNKTVSLRDNYKK
ncbi:MAG: glutamine--tRNA ligase/YqeY domain fusion protein [Flavobacteriaceae bacterium]|nr:glutamine--tRNA ligase/YqeY domain fusion protein [Flavobacteriaceae bacterium]